MYELKTNTAYRIAVGPLVDPGDGKTAETSLTVTGMTCDILQMDNDGTAVNRTSFAPTASGGDNDMVHVGSDAVGMYDLELTAAQLNWLGNARLVFYDVDGFLVHWIDIQVVSAAYFDWKYGTTIPNVNVTQISEDSTAADNAERFFDGTGYAGTNNVIPTVTAITNGVTLANDAITAAKFDESTAFPLTSADTGATAVARTGADSDTLETLSDEIAAVKAETATIVADTNELQTDWTNGGRLDVILDTAVSPLGAGSITWEYTITSSVDGVTPIENVQVWVSSDIAGTNIIATGYTDSTGVVTFYLDAGTVYVWRQKNGYNFVNPDTEVVS